MKKIGIPTIISLLMVSAASAATIDEIGVWIVPKGGPVTENGEVLASLSAKGIDAIVSFQFGLEYDPKIIIARNVTKGDAISDASFESKIDNEKGNIIIRIEKREGFSVEEGSIAKIQFGVIGTKGMSTPLDIAGLEALDSEHNHVPLLKVTNAEYTVGREIGAEIPIPIEQIIEPTETEIIPTETKGALGFGIITAILIMLAIYFVRKNK